MGSAALTEGLLHRLDGRDVQRVVGRMTGHNGRDQRHAQRVQHARGDFQLGPVGVVLAVAELHQPLLGQHISVGVGGGRVVTNRVGGELVDADGLLVQFPFQDAKGVVAAEPVEPVGEPVIMESDGQDPFAQQGREGAVVLGHPGFDVVEAVVALREEEQQPDSQHLTRGERAFPVGRGGEVAVQGGGQVKTLQGGPQDGQVGNDFDTQQAGFSGVHPSFLPRSPFPENHPEHERTAGSEGQEKQQLIERIGTRSFGDSRPVS